MVSLSNPDVAFSLNFYSYPGVPPGSYARTSIQGTISDTAVVVETKTEGGEEYALGAVTDQLRLGGAWPKTISRQLAAMQPEEGGAWKRGGFSARCISEGRQSSPLGCSLSVGEPPSMAGIVDDGIASARWYEIAESINAAAMGKDLCWRFIWVSDKGQSTEMCLRQNTQLRTVSVVARRGEHSIASVPAELDEWLSVRALLEAASAPPWRGSTVDKSRECARALLNRSPERWCYFFRKGRTDAAVGERFFLTLPGRPDVLAWNDIVCWDTKCRDTLLEKLCELSRRVGVALPLPKG